MAITVDPSFTPPAPAQKVTSPDGLLTVEVDAANAGVLLWADFAGSPEQIIDTNLFPDPAMTGGAAAWPTTGGTVANGPEGGIKTTATATGYVIASNTSNPVTGLAGASTLYVSADVRTTGATGPGVQVAQVDASGASLGNAAFYAAAIPAGVWKRVTFPIPLAAGTDHTSKVQLIRSSGATVGDTTEWRNLRFSTVADGPYFTGSTAPDGTYSYRWTGTPNASTSQKYVPGVGGLDPLPDVVEFRRGDGTLVRSGDPASAPGGVAVAYDHEAPIGSAASYYAVPQAFDGTDGAPTDTVTVAISWVWDASDVWLKSPTNPGKSLRVAAATFEETARPLRSSFTTIRGSRVGASTWDVTGGLTGTLTVKTDGKDAYDAMLSLLDGGPVLVQAHPTLGGIPAFYAMPQGDLLSLRRVETGRGYDMRSWPLSLVECRRPATLDAPLRIPGNTAETLPDRYPTCADLLSRVGSCAELLGVDL